MSCQEFITQLGRNFQVIYQSADDHGNRVQAAGNNMANTDAAVGSTGSDLRIRVKPRSSESRTGLSFFIALTC